MRLRHILVIALLTSAIGPALVALDFSFRVHIDASAKRADGALSMVLPSTVGAPYLVVLAASGVTGLASLLLLAATFREERRRALLRVELFQQKPTQGAGGRPLATDEQPQGESNPSLSDRTVSWPWGKVIPWRSDLGRDFCDLWNTSCTQVFGACPKEWGRFEKFFEAPEFDPEASAAAVDTDGRFRGALLALRQPGFEDDGYWWLESPTVVAVLLVDPEKRNKGIGRAMMQYMEGVVLKHKRPRIFVGGLENFPHLVPGVPDQDHATRMFLNSLGYREVRRTCHMEATFNGFEVPQDLVDREKRLAKEGYSFEAGEWSHAEAFKNFMEESNLGRKQRRLEKFKNENRHYFFVLKDDLIVGFIQVTPKDDRGQSGIHLIYFLRAHRGVGLGSILLNKAHQLWKEMNASGGSIWTYPEAAERFYPRAGFKTIQEWVCFEKDLHRSWGDPEFVNRWR